MEENILGIIVSGGCAPGINGVIGAAAEFAHRLHWKVIGFQEGYKYLSAGNPEIVSKHIIEITEDLALRKSCLGGSVVKTDRTDISKNPEAISNTFKMLKHFNVRYLLAIGGNEKIRMCYNIAQGVDPTQMQVIAIPKTISNDIQLPVEQSSFGYHTARSFGAKLVHNLVVDAQSQPRWFIVESMGKQTGHLALTICEAAGADLAVIPEDFKEKTIGFSDICDIIEGTILKKLASGINYGVVVLSEGLITKITEEDRNMIYSSQGITASPNTFLFSEVEISRSVSDELRRRIAKRKIHIHVTPEIIGYELRGARPHGFDSIYARELGVGAINGFLMGHSNSIVIWNNGQILFRSFRSLVDPITGYIKPREVDTNSYAYKVGRQDMCFLQRFDLSDPKQLQLLASAANSTPEQFLADFVHVPDLFVT